MHVKKSDGFSVLEALLTLTILSVIATLLLPTILNMQQNVDRKKVDVKVVETALNGMRFVKFHHQLEGTIVIDDEPYKWHYQGGEICVDYTLVNEKKERCFSND